MVSIAVAVEIQKLKANNQCFCLIICLIKCGSSTFAKERAACFALCVFFRIVCQCFIDLFVSAILAFHGHILLLL